MSEQEDKTLQVWELESRIRNLTENLEAREAELSAVRTELADGEAAVGELKELRRYVELLRSSRPGLHPRMDEFLRLKAKLKHQAAELRKLRAQNPDGSKRQPAGSEPPHVTGPSKPKKQKQRKVKLMPGTPEDMREKARQLRRKAARLEAAANNRKIQSLPGPAFVEEPQRTSDWV